MKYFVLFKKILTKNISPFIDLSYSTVILSFWSNFTQSSAVISAAQCSLLLPTIIFLLMIALVYQYSFCFLVKFLSCSKLNSPTLSSMHFVFYSVVTATHKLPHLNMYSNMVFAHNRVLREEAAPPAMTPAVTEALREVGVAISLASLKSIGCLWPQWGWGWTTMHLLNPGGMIMVGMKPCNWWQQLGLVLTFFFKIFKFSDD